MATSPFALDPEESRVFLSGPTNGKRKVSAALLSPPSSHRSSSSSSSNSSTSIRIRPFDPSTKAPFDLPEDTESVACLEFLGYTRKVAEDIFKRWTGRPDPERNPDDLIQYALSYLGRLFFQPLKDLPATQAMTGLEISDELQAALTDPHFSQIFRSQTLHYWLKDTMSIRYSTLNKLLEPGVFESGASSSTQEPPTFTVSSNIASEDNNLPSAHVTVQAAPLALPDHYILYKGKAWGDLYGGLLFIRDDGSVNLRSVQIREGGDFNHLNSAWYWTLEEATAEEYRKWGQLRCNWAETWIIQIQVPKTFVDSIRKQQLWYSPDWKEYVWYCRKGNSVGDPPAKFNKSWKAGQSQLVEGHICAREPTAIPRINKEELPEKITEGDVLNIDGRKATQWAFVDAEVVERLSNLVRGKIHIEMFPAGYLC
ncbi:MAG: hypothetical protein M1819_003986 [Sarea resinae]|nr:MAG: hypothetical protein M1819_003986 [Sarea resinae]